MAAALLALALFELTSFGRSPAPQWIDERAGAIAQVETAWKALALGKATAALRAFESVLPVWEAHAGDGRGYADTERGIVVSAIFAHDDAAAAAMIARIRRESGGLSTGTALILAGHWVEAIDAYLRDTARAPLAPGPDGVIGNGVRDVHAGNWHRAIVAWSQPPDGEGPGCLLDMQRVLIGVARARLDDWEAAARDWVAASRIGRAVPGWENLETGNIAALELLYHFRDRYSRGDAGPYVRDARIAR
jgi:hypothetical protein